MPTLETIARQQLEKLEKTAKKRVLSPGFQNDALYLEENGRRYLSFASNDYLALSAHPEVIASAKAALEKYGAGATASRLVAGNHPLYAELETALAAYKGMESALVFGSGYLTSLGVIPALVGRGDVIIADRLAHACMLDGAKNSGAVLKRFRHNDLAHLEMLLKEFRGRYRHCLVLTEHVFSMDGDLAPLAAIKTICDMHDAWLMSDDAHGLAPADTKPHLLMGTLSKSLGSYGGYIAGPKTVIDYLQSSARSLIFSTGLPPSVIAAASTALKIAKAEPVRGKKALENAQRFTKALHLPAAQSAIVPVILGDAQKALAASAQLKADSFFVPAIRPPTVPEGSARLRFSFTAAHEDAHMEKIIEAMRKWQ